MNIVFKYGYARSPLERAFTEAGQFAHVSEADIAAAFDDAENRAIPDFEYNYPAFPQHAFENMRKEQWAWPWSCSRAAVKHQIGERVLFEYYAAPMSILLWKRHGCLCGLCMNPTAKFRVFGLRLERQLEIGKTGDESDRLPNCCADCMPLGTLDDWSTEDRFLAAMRRELNRPGSKLVMRLRSAPKLRFEPRRRLAA